MTVRTTRLIIPLAMLLVCAGCALAPYGPSDGKGPGYTDRKLPDGRHEVIVYGKDQAPSGGWAGRSRERQLRQNIFRRAEEICESPLYTLDRLRSGMAKRGGGMVAPTISAIVTCSDATP